LTGAPFCFPGQDLKGVAHKKNMTSHPIYVLFAGAKEYFYNEPFIVWQARSQTTSLFARI